MHVYIYEGPVFQFDQIIAHHWTGQTVAPTEAKAKSNLTYQFKKKTNRLPNTRITLPGKLIMVE